nr:hypothetical protein [uncultured Flavobacterium sp.]
MEYKLLEIVKDLLVEKMYKSLAMEDAELVLNLPEKQYNELLAELNSYAAGIVYPQGFKPSFTTFNFMGGKCYIQQSELKNKDSRDFLQAYEQLKK